MLVTKCYVIVYANKNKYYCSTVSKSMQYNHRYPSFINCSNVTDSFNHVTDYLRYRKFTIQINYEK